MECEICGFTEELQHHHESYDPPKIRILCTSCHQLQHQGHGIGLAHFEKKPIPANFPDLWKLKTYSELTKLLGVSHMTICNWAKKFGLGIKTKARIPPKTKEKVGITIDEHVLKELDERRGLVSRSRFVEEILKKGLGYKYGTTKRTPT